MKKTLVTTLVSVGLGLFASHSALAAQGGTITINGKVVDTTCQVKAGGENKTVTLPTIAKSAVTAAGAVAGTRAPFVIELENCAASNDLTQVNAYFEPDANVNASGRLNNIATTTPKASNMEIQLLAADGTSVININGDAAAQTAGFTAMSANVQLRYFAQYYATANSVTVGDVQGRVNYILAYK